MALIGRILQVSLSVVVLAIGLLAMRLALDGAPAVDPAARQVGVYGDWRVPDGRALYLAPEYLYQLGYGYLQADGLERAVNGLALINTAEQRDDVWAAPGEPRLDMVRRPARRKGDPAHAEGVGLAAPHRHAQRAIAPRHGIARLQGHQFGPPRQHVIAQRQHRPVAPPPGRLRLHGDERIQILCGQALGLLRSAEFGAFDPADGDVYLFVGCGVGQTQQPVDFSDGIEPTADCCGRGASSVRLKVAAEINHTGRKGRDVIGLAPGFEMLDIGSVGAQGGGRESTVKPLDLRPPG